MNTELKDKIKHKVKATAIHLFLSLIVFAVILYYILYKWYPEPFFTAQGGWQGIRLMALVDLVLGPSLTLIVYNHLKKKKEIGFDLSIIAFVQIAALIVGGYSVYSQRPIALVFWANTFYTVTDDDYYVQGIRSPEFSEYSDNVPPLIYSRPVLTELDLEITTTLTENAIPAYAHVHFYEKIEDNLDYIFMHSLDIHEIMLTNSVISNGEMVREINKITKGDVDNYKYLDLAAKYHNMVLVLDKEGGLAGSVKAPAR